MVNKLLLAILFVSSTALADSQTEIQRLLDFVAGSACEYERNGTLYKAKDAVAHINSKYDYYADNIETAEEFIEYSATRSKLSGKDYFVHCPSQDVMKSSEWLLKELSNIRKNPQSL